MYGCKEREREGGWAGESYFGARIHNALQDFIDDWRFEKLKQ